MSSQSEEQLKKAFDRIDKSGDGKISVDELKNYYLPMQEILGVNKEVALQELRGLLRRLDVDESGTVTFEGKIDVFPPRRKCRVVLFFVKNSKNSSREVNYRSFFLLANFISNLFIFNKICVKIIFNEFSYVLSK